MRKIVEARVLGPYAEKDRWRIIILEKGVRRSEYLATLPEARKRISQLKKQQGKAEAFTVGMMLEEYTKEREVLGKVLPRTSQMEAARIRDFLGTILSNNPHPASAGKIITNRSRMGFSARTPFSS